MEEGLQRVAEIVTIVRLTSLLVSTSTFPLRTLKCTSVWSVGRGKDERNTQSAVQMCRVRRHDMDLTNFLFRRGHKSMPAHKSTQTLRSLLVTKQMIYQWRLGPIEPNKRRSHNTGHVQQLKDPVVHGGTSESRAQAAEMFESWRIRMLPYFLEH